MYIRLADFVHPQPSCSESLQLGSTNVRAAIVGPKVLMNLLHAVGALESAAFS
jgi:hypothetical protein